MRAALPKLLPNIATHVEHKGLGGWGERKLGTRNRGSSGGRRALGVSLGQERRGADGDARVVPVLPQMLSEGRPADSAS
jgi:hypothetical protein